MICEFCGQDGHEDMPCPVRRESAAKYAEWGRKAYPRASGIEAKVCKAIRGRCSRGVADFLCREITKRQQLGIQKYGQELADNPASIQARLQHALEESLDLTVYLAWAYEITDDGAMALKLMDFERYAIATAEGLVYWMQRMERRAE